MRPCMRSEVCPCYNRGRSEGSESEGERRGVARTLARGGCTTPLLT